MRIKVPYIIFSTVTSLFIVNPRVLMPNIVASLLKTIANATFTIFLVHMSFFYLYYVLTRWATQNGVFHTEMFLFSFVGSLLFWILWDGLQKAYFQTKQQILTAR